MPALDGTGPLGLGPMTGGGRGLCPTLMGFGYPVNSPWVVRASWGLYGQPARLLPPALLPGLRAGFPRLLPWLFALPGQLGWELPGPGLIGAWALRPGRWGCQRAAFRRGRGWWR